MSVYKREYTLELIHSIFSKRNRFLLSSVPLGSQVPGKDNQSRSADSKTSTEIERSSYIKTSKEITENRTIENMDVNQSVENQLSELNIHNEIKNHQKEKSALNNTPSTSKEVFEKQKHGSSINVSKIRKAFEITEEPEIVSQKTRKPLLKDLNNCLVFNSFGSTAIQITEKNHSNDLHGSITSLASSTSTISQKDLQGLIEEANQTFEESVFLSEEIIVVVLHKELPSGSLGISIAGGADYESKDITVYKVIPGSLAFKDGRIQKGDKIISINGKSTKGMNHIDALATLKTHRSKVVLVVSKSGKDITTPSFIRNQPSLLSDNLNSGKLFSSDQNFDDNIPRGPPLSLTLRKEGTGLGFSLDGGKHSLFGDRPLTIKKIFTGSIAEKASGLEVGDELLSVNNEDVSKMTRIEAWNFMKSLPNGNVAIVVRQKSETKESKEFS